MNRELATQENTGLVIDGAAEASGVVLIEFFTVKSAAQTRHSTCPSPKSRPREITHIYIFRWTLAFDPFDLIRSSFRYIERLGMV